MARLLLADDEDLLDRFRPHPGSYLVRYARSTLWLAYGLLAWYLAARWLPGTDWLPSAIFGGFGIAHAAVVKTLDQRGVARALTWTAIAGLTVLFLFLQDPGPPLTWFGQGWPVGLVATVVGLTAAEFDRSRRVADLTSKRLIRRTGIGRLVEETLPLDRVESVRASQGPLGQVFGFGQLTLTLAPAGGRRRKGDPPPTLVLRGVPRWEIVKHHLEILLEEHRLPAKQRSRKVEDRRLREAMRAVAAWSRGEDA